MLRTNSILTKANTYLGPMKCVNFLKTAILMSFWRNLILKKSTVNASFCITILLIIKITFTTLNTRKKAVFVIFTTKTKLKYLHPNTGRRLTYRSHKCKILYCTDHWKGNAVKIRSSPRCCNNDEGFIYCHWKDTFGKTGPEDDFKPEDLLWSV